jgi:putative DNA primase/helicase
LATELGITGWREGEANDAAKRCFLAWLGRRGTTGSSDVEAGIIRVRSFLGSHGTSRFQVIHHPSRANDAKDEALVVRDRVGFRRWNADTDETEYLILRDAFKDEVCKGQPYQAVLKELDKRGFLVRDGLNLTIKARLPELGTPRVYCIRGSILEGDDAGRL